MLRMHVSRVDGGERVEHSIRYQPIRVVAPFESYAVYSESDGGVPVRTGIRRYR